MLVRERRGETTWLEKSVGVKAKSEKQTVWGITE